MVNLTSTHSFRQGCLRLEQILLNDNFKHTQGNQHFRKSGVDFPRTKAQSCSWRKCTSRETPSGFFTGSFGALRFSEPPPNADGPLGRPKMSLASAILPCESASCPNRAQTKGLSMVQMNETRISEFRAPTAAAQIEQQTSYSEKLNDPERNKTDFTILYHLSHQSPSPAKT